MAKHNSKAFSREWHWWLSAFLLVVGMWLAVVSLVANSVPKDVPPDAFLGTPGPLILVLALLAASLSALFVVAVCLRAIAFAGWAFGFVKAQRRVR